MLIPHAAHQNLRVGVFGFDPPYAIGRALCGKLLNEIETICA
jgi:hypothetical protein